jgi:hypothetical protein
MGRSLDSGLGCKVRLNRIDHDHPSPQRLPRDVRGTLRGAADGKIAGAQMQCDD